MNARKSGRRAKKSFGVVYLFSVNLLAVINYSKPEKSTDGAHASAPFSNYGCWYRHALVVINLLQIEYARSVFFINFLYHLLNPSLCSLGYM